MVDYTRNRGRIRGVLGEFAPIFASLRRPFRSPGKKSLDLMVDARHWPGGRVESGSPRQIPHGERCFTKQRMTEYRQATLDGISPSISVGHKGKAFQQATCDVVSSSVA